MKKLIRDRATRAFLTKEGQWSHDLKKAREFRYIDEILSAKNELELQQAEIYYALRDDHPCKEDFYLPLQPARPVGTLS